MERLQHPLRRTIHLRVGRKDHHRASLGLPRLHHRQGSQPQDAAVRETGQKDFRKERRRCDERPLRGHSAGYDHRHRSRRQRPSLQMEADGLRVQGLALCQREGHRHPADRFLVRRPVKARPPGRCRRSHLVRNRRRGDILPHPDLHLHRQGAGMLQGRQREHAQVLPYRLLLDQQPCRQRLLQGLQHHGSDSPRGYRQL